MSKPATEPGYMGARPRGLDLTNPDVTTLEEWESWREDERINRGYPLPTYEILGEIGRADAVKRWFQQIHYFTTPTSFTTTLRFLHYYLIEGFEDGVIYELRNCERNGHAKAEVADAVAVAFLHAPSKGMHVMSDRAREYLRTYREPVTPFRWPDGWTREPERLHSGLDFSDPEMQPGELERLHGWYERVLGEVPRSVRLLGEFRPNLLKTWRNRFEHCLRAAPTQLLPYLLVHYESLRGHEEGIREAMLLARGLGLPKTHAIDAMVWSMLYGGTGAMANAERAAGDILRSW
jgi:hypothetical protein